MKKQYFAALAAAFVLAAALFSIPAASQQIPAVGQTAPAFTLPSQDGTQISLKSFRGQWVVLYFYPRDMTPGCTVEAHNFQAALPQFQAHHAVILGVSVDSVDSHQQFCTKEGLAFRLLSDSAHTVTKAYGSLGSMGGVAIANRNTFLINPKGKIAKLWTAVQVQGHAAEVLAALPGVNSMARPVPIGNNPVKPPVTTNSVAPHADATPVKPPVNSTSETPR